jgi:hypothetical protein
LERAYLLRETVSHVLVRCDWDNGRRAAISLPRNGTGWQSWAVSSGGRLVAAYLVGAYRDTVVGLERPAFVQDQHPAPESAHEARGIEPQRRLRPDWIPARGRWAA